VRLFLDECLSPQIAQEFNATGEHVAHHPRDFGGRGDPDHVVLARCIREDLVLVTQNARDFRALVGAAPIHPGLIVLPSVDGRRTKELLDLAMAYLTSLGDPMDVMVNHVLEVDEDGVVKLCPLPENT
jgi:predicted nuclease of predicted toxin-antitoxin system